MPTIKDEILDAEIAQSDQNMNECYGTDSDLFNFCLGYSCGLRFLRIKKNNQP